MEGIRLAGLLLVFLLQMPHNNARIDEGTNTFYANNKNNLKKTKIMSKPENQDPSKNWRDKGQAEFLQADAEDRTDIRNVRDEDHPKEKFFVANDMDLGTAKSKTPFHSEPNVFEDLEDYRKTNDVGSQLNDSHKTRQHQQQSDMRKVRSSRQRRTVQTPETTLVCQDELSCRNKCQNPRTVLYQTQLSCFCDEDCELFLDCCADYDDFCGTNGQTVTNSTKQNTSTAESLVNQQNRAQWSCYKGEDMDGARGVWMIGSCPSSWPEDDVLYRCRNLSQTNKITMDNYRYPSVYTSNGRVYHNRFCAQCNGVSSKNWRTFSLSIECEFTPPRQMSFDSAMSYLFSYCRKIRPSHEINWSPNKGDPRRYCLDIIPEVYWFCNFNIDVKMNLSLYLTGKPRIVTGRYFYRNIDCALQCDNRMNQISCGPNITASFWEGYIPWKYQTLSIIFDLNNNTDSRGLNLMQIKTHCFGETVYDHYLDICRDTIPAIPSFADFYEYEVIIWLHEVYFTYETDSLSTSEEKVAKLLAVPSQHVKNLKGNIFDRLMFTLEIRKNERIQANLRNILDFTSPFNVTFDKSLYTIIKAAKRVLSCVNRQKYDRSEYTVLQYGSSAVSIKKTGEVFQYIDYYINTTEASTSANDSQAIFVCHQHQISNCSGVYILINEGEFRVLMNKSIFVNASKQVYDWSEYIWQDEKVLVCEIFSTTYYKSKVVSNDDPLLTTITLVCMSLSIIGLVFVLVTYSLFSELRTPPGINLMNLSVSILLTQLLWVVETGQTDTPMACTVIAVILHYLFLVSFMWTSIITFDTWKALSSENQAFSDPDIQVVRHMAVGWLSTLIYVSICVILGLTDTLDIGHQNRIACWIADKWAILYFFAVPVFLLLAFNMVICVKIFRAIKDTTAQPEPASYHDTKKNFGIYVRITSLIALTWIFEFVAPFGWQLLWYPFVILNGSQGLYIALAFAFNKKARSLYKRLFKGRSPSNEESNTSVPRAKTDDTEYNSGSADTKL